MTTTSDPGALERALQRLADVHHLVVASDFDGTIAPLAPVPAAAAAMPAAIDALSRLAAIPGTAVAVISGRALADLQARTQEAGMTATVELVGSHGLEFASDCGFNIDAAAQARLHRLAIELDHLAAELPGTLVERKPFSVTFHYRNADPAAAADVVAGLRAALAGREGVWTKDGHLVLEVFVLPASKSWAIDVLRSRQGEQSGSAVLYVGDDATDEDVFADLRRGDLGCKVGEGDTAACYRVAGPDAVVAMLDMLAAARAARVAGVREQAGPRV